MKLRVVFTPEAQEQLVELFNYIAAQASPTIALHFTDSVVQFCQGLQPFPNRGVARNDIREGLRITHYKKRTIIAFCVGNDCVTIVGIFHGGQNYSRNLLQEP